MADPRLEDTVEVGHDTRVRPRLVVAAVAVAALLVAGGIAARAARPGSVATHGADPTPAAWSPGATTWPVEHRAARTVPFRDLGPHHPALGRAGTSYDSVSATGEISGTVHPGDTLAFAAVLQAPGLVSLLPCPDYTITVGSLTTTRQLNCAQVPFYASLVRSNGRVTSFRPVLPAGTPVAFRMRVQVPDRPGRQQVRWALVGTHGMAAFSGYVEVTQR